MQIMDEMELLKIQDEALEFTKNNISTDNWDLIYDLKRQLLISEGNLSALRKDLTKQIERAEGRWQDKLDNVYAERNRLIMELAEIKKERDQFKQRLINKEK